MSREIKFRAWDKDNRAMKVVSELDFLYEKSQKMTWGMQGVVSDVWLNGEDESYIPIDVVMLQYTGLKDKNGTEIHEGDIVKDSNGKKYWVKWGVNSNGFIAKTNEPHCNVYSTYHLAPKVEVIGNIYENPELLEV